MKWLWKWPEAIDKFLAQGGILLIRIYQKTFSPDHSPVGKLNPTSGCRFFPTCSEYARITLEKKGFVLSLWKIFSRVVRCTPWSKGGIDLPPGVSVDDPVLQSTLPPKFLDRIK
jgi:putative membrane protein insertion efficiency factor